MAYVMSIDGGGSKTACLLADETGKLRGYGKSGPVNSNYTSRDLVIKAIRSAISSCLQGADLGEEPIDSLFISAPISPDILQEGILPFKINQVKRAAEGETPRWAVRFWVEDRVGVTVDAGTGSLARGWSADGREAGAGGWGATLGDEGSGFWIGMQAMIAILQASDGRIEPTELTAPVLDHFGFTDLLDMVFKVSHGLVNPQESGQIGIVPDSDRIVLDGNGEQEGGIQFHKRDGVSPLTRYEVASLCPVVEKVARAGDKKALEIFNQAGIELARLALAVIKRLGMERDQFAVIPFGGVFRANDLVLGSFRKTLLATASRAKLIRPRYEPVVGGIFLALDQIGVQIQDSIILSIEESSENFPQIIID